MVNSLQQGQVLDLQYNMDIIDESGTFYVVNIEYNATTLQRTHYYPSGLPWRTTTGIGADVQNRKYNGKEFVEMHGLDEYDSEARWYYPAIMRTTTIDPLAEDYYDISPYVFCLNNAIKFNDPTGQSPNDTITIEKKLEEVVITASKINPTGSRAMDPVTGFWNWAYYLAFGRTYRNWEVNSQGVIT